MSDLPDPLSPPDCDLRGYDFMPLFGQKLFGSAFYSLALTNPRAGLAGMKLWWEAWLQRPAGSLPADDMSLCRMADFGSEMKAWLRVKEIALHGFILCSDGRLYHELICQEAKIAHRKRVQDRERKASWRATRGDGHAGQDADVTRDTTRTGRGHDADVPADRTGQDRTGQDKERKTPLGPPSEGGRRRRGESKNGWVAYRTEEEELADAARATAH